MSEIDTSVTRDVIVAGNCTRFVYFRSGRGEKRRGPKSVGVSHGVLLYFVLTVVSGYFRSIAALASIPIRDTSRER